MQFKKFIKYISKIIFFSVVFAFLAWLLIGRNIENGSPLSPLPDFLTLSKNKQVRFLDLWFPALEKKDVAGFDTSFFTAESAIVYDLTDNKTIFEKNPTKKLAMASITKIMTAIVAIENKKNDDKYLVKKENLVGENVMGLDIGEVLSLEDLLYGLILPSGNDAAEVLASNFPTGRRGFIKAMNDKARSMGLFNTVFSNPSGLQGDGLQQTTTEDLVVITKYGLENHPLFAEVVATPEHQIPKTYDHKSYYLYNETNLLTTYEGVKGVKTGYTPEAGFCLVTYIDYGGHELIAVILNSENRREEMIELLDFSLNSLGIAPPKYRG